MTDKQKHDVAQEYLRKYRHLELKIKSLEEEAITIYAKMGYQSPRFDSEGGGSGIATSKVEKYMDKYMAIKDEIEAEKNKAVIEYEKILKICLKLKDGYKLNIVMSRYIHFKKWDEIWYDLEISSSTGFRIHDEALVEIYNMIWE